MDFTVQISEVQRNIKMFVIPPSGHVRWPRYTKLATMTVNFYYILTL